MLVDEATPWKWHGFPYLKSEKFRKAFGHRIPQASGLPILNNEWAFSHLCMKIPAICNANISSG